MGVAITIDKALKSGTHQHTITNVVAEMSLAGDEIVRSAIQSHSGRHRVERVSDTTVTQIENRDDEEDRTSRKRLLDLIDKLVVPEDLGDIEVPVILSGDPTGFGSVPEVVASLPHSLDTSIGEKVLEDLETFDDHRALWGSLIELLRNDDKYNRHQHIKDTWDEKGEPKPDETSRIRSGNSGESSDIDGPVE
jgi:hypothetical protein